LDVSEGVEASPEAATWQAPPTREEMMADADREYREAVKAIAALSVPADVKEALRCSAEQLAEYLASRERKTPREEPRKWKHLQ
jgi:hypothetical protein